MILAQVSVQAGDGGALLVYGLIILAVFLPVAILRWIIRVNDVVRNQEEMITLLRKMADQRDH